jgi:hypothetical protein
MTDSAPEVSTVDTAPADAQQTGSETTPENKPASSVVESANTFDPASVVVNTGGADAPRRGRPRKDAGQPAQESEAARKAAKRQRDREYRERMKNGTAGTGHTQQDTQRPDSAPGGDFIPATSSPELLKVAAVMVVGSIDTILAGLSDGEYIATPEARAAYIQVWIDYLRSTGKEPPPWLMLIIASTGYVGAAFNYPATQSKFTKLKNRISGWWVKKFGA